MGGEERTESATPRKRSELRRRGQVPKSQDLSSMAVLVGLIVCLHSVGGTASQHLQRYLESSFGGLNHATLTSNSLWAAGTAAGMVLLRTVGPVALTAMLLGVSANLLQTGIMVSSQALMPDFNRVNPLSGFQRFFSGRGLVEAAKAVGKLAIVGWLAWSTVQSGYAGLFRSSRQEPGTAAGEVGEFIYRLSLRVALFLLVLAALDYAYQRWAFERSIRMTRQEVRQDFKQSEGDPQLRGRIRKRMRQLAKRRMMESVPKADVVVTNPTHYAVALKYDSESMAAPQVVAKGADLVAQRIRDLAGEHHVPIIENPPLARQLYRVVEIGQEIPADLYGAVAEVLAFVYQINQRRAGAVA